MNHSMISAAYDPRSVPNNRFGIHIVDPLDLTGVKELINSSGGEWGYVKLVIPDNDRNTGKWDAVFRELRRKKLIPIVRLATHVKGNAWVKPTEDSIRDWPAFLQSLSWPTENRYVVLFNEPNHAKEWGGDINPEEYVSLADSLAKQLKATSEDFFILPAGLDVSASTDNESLDAEVFLRRMVKSNPDFFTRIDGWTSHSYPNPGFSSSPNKTGRGSLFSFDWELQTLRSLGINKNLPVLIGETGWTHQDGVVKNTSYLPVQTVAQYYSIASQTVWQNPHIFAVIPFIYNYQGEPFAHFSFRKFGGVGYHDHYFAYQAINKIKGKPKQRESYQLLRNPFPEKLVAGSTYTFPLEIQNSGQAIISSLNGYSLQFEEVTGNFEIVFSDIPEIEPGAVATIQATLTVLNTPGRYETKLSLRNDYETFDLGFATLTVLPPPTLSLTAQLGWKRTSEASEASVLIYDGDALIYKFEKLPVKNGEIITPGVLDIIPERSYRIVTLIPYYLPRQVIQPISEQVTFVENKRFLPFDTDNNQRFDSADILKLFLSSPWSIIPRYFGQ